MSLAIIIRTFISWEIHQLRRLLISSLLLLLLFAQGAIFALAQDQTNSSLTDSLNRPVSSGINSAVTNPDSDSARSGKARPETFKLFAGVSHKEMLPEASVALKPHLDRQQKPSLKVYESANAPRLYPLVESAQIHQENLSAQVAQTAPVMTAPRSNVLAARTSATQSYIPSFGVARETVERTPEPARPQQHYRVDWFMLPNWMAGVWLKDGDMTTSVTDLQTGVSSTQNEWTPNRLEATWGHQQDAEGNYWHANVLPSERDGSSAGKLVRFLLLARQCESSSPQQMVTRTHYIVSESNPWNNQPLDTFQQESLNHYALNSQGQLLNSSSNRVFSYQGTPIREGHLVSQFAKIKQFTPVASLNGFDLRASLNDYLESHSLGHLRK